MDVLNAMAAGTPVIAAQRGSLPEVVGKAGILIDPKDSNSIAQAIDKVLSLKKTEYNKLVTKGLARVEKFSWEKTARETLAIENLRRTMLSFQFGLKIPIQNLIH